MLCWFKGCEEAKLKLTQQRDEWRESSSSYRKLVGDLQKQIEEAPIKISHYIADNKSLSARCIELQEKISQLRNKKS